MKKKKVKLVFPKDLKVLHGGSRVAKTEKPIAKPVKTEPKPIELPKVKIYTFFITLMSNVIYETTCKQISSSNINWVPSDEARKIIAQGFQDEQKWFSPNIIKQVRWEER